MAVLFCLLIAVLSISQSKGSDDALTVICNTMESVPLLKPGIMSLKDICTAELYIEYDASKERALTTGIIEFFFEDPFTNERKHLGLISMGAVTQKWVLDTTLPADITIPEEMCGGGVLVAEIFENSVLVVSQQTRAVLLCDNSGTDYELYVNLPNTGGLNLPADGMTDVFRKLQDDYGFMAFTLTPHQGNLPKVTRENPHMVFAYLRRMGDIAFNRGHCDVPEYKLTDEIVANKSFIDGSSDGTPIDLLHQMDTHPIRADTKFCGHAELVFMFDPLRMEWDADVCNNYVVVQVNITCSAGHHYPTENRCLVVGSPVTTSELWTLYDDMLYKYQDMDQSWHGLHSSYDDEKKFILFGMARVDKFHDYLKSLHTYAQKGLCKYIREKMDVMLDASDATTTTDTSLDLKIGDAMTLIQNIGADLDSSAVDAKLEEIRTTELTASDYDKNMKVEAAVHTLEILKELKKVKSNYTKYGLPVPKQFMRHWLGRMLFEAGMSIAYGGSTGSHAFWVSSMLKTLIRYMEQTGEFDQDVINLVKKAYHGIQKILADPTSATPNTCPDGEKLPEAVDLLLYLGNGFNGDSDEDVDVNALDFCHKFLMATYMKYGGSRMQSKDIASDLVKVDPGTSLPDKCIKHPFDHFYGGMKIWKNDEGYVLLVIRLFPSYIYRLRLLPSLTFPRIRNKDDTTGPTRTAGVAFPFGSFEVTLGLMWETPDGRIMVGAYSPISKSLTWRVVARCQCDTCMPD